MPVGARYSVDAILRAARGQPVRQTATALPMRLGQLQIAWVHADTILHKWPGQSWHNGTALRLALGLDHLFTRAMGRWLFDVRPAIKVGTYLRLVLECNFLPLVFLPLWKPKGLPKDSPWRFFFQPTYKALAIAGGTALHLGIAFTMAIGNFSYIMISAYFLLYEPEWIEAIVRALGRAWAWLAATEGATVFYDGECGLCSATWLLPSRLRPLWKPDPRRLSPLGGDGECRHRPPGTRSAHASAGAGRANTRRLFGRGGVGSPGSWSGTAWPAGFDPGQPLPRRSGLRSHRGRRRSLHAGCDASCALPSEADGWGGRLRGWLAELIPTSTKQTATDVLHATLAFLMFLCLWFAVPRQIRNSHCWISTSRRGGCLQLPARGHPGAGTVAGLGHVLPQPHGHGRLPGGTRTADRWQGGGRPARRWAWRPAAAALPQLLLQPLEQVHQQHRLPQRGLDGKLQFGHALSAAIGTTRRPSGRFDRPSTPFRSTASSAGCLELEGSEPVPWGEEKIWDHHCF